MAAFNFDPPTEDAPKRAGRPKGSLNKTVLEKMIVEQFEDLYSRVEHMLSPDQKKYYKEAFSGKVEFDPLRDGELYAKLLSVYTITITTEALAQKKASKEVADVINQYRQMLLNIEEMRRKREETRTKNNDDGRMVDPTRKSAMGRFESLHRELPRR